MIALNHGIATIDVNAYPGHRMTEGLRLRKGTRKDRSKGRQEKGPMIHAQEILSVISRTGGKMPAVGLVIDEMTVVTSHAAIARTMAHAQIRTARRTSVRISLAINSGTINHVIRTAISSATTRVRAMTVISNGTINHASHSVNRHRSTISMRSSNVTAFLK